MSTDTKYVTICGICLPDVEEYTEEQIRRALPAVPEATITRKFRDFFEEEPSTVPRADLLLRFGIRRDGSLHPNSPTYYGKPIFMSQGHAGETVLHGPGWKAVSTTNADLGERLNPAAIRRWLGFPAPGLPSLYIVRRGPEINPKLASFIRRPDGQWVPPNEMETPKIERPVSHRLRQIDQKLLDLEHRRKELVKERDTLIATIRYMNNIGQTV